MRWSCDLSVAGGMLATAEGANGVCCIMVMMNHVAGRLSSLRPPPTRTSNSPALGRPLPW